MSLMSIISDLAANNDIKDVFVDCGQGDKFIIKDAFYSKNEKSLVLKIDRSSVKWIELDGKNPVKLTAENT